MSLAALPEAWCNVPTLSGRHVVLEPLAAALAEGSSGAIDWACVGETNAVARSMAQRAGRLFILADHTKLGVVSRINYASPREISLLITDTGAAELPALKELKDILPKVVLA